MKLDTVAVWNDLHKTPELGFQEFKTSAYIAAALEKMGYAVTRGIAGTGVLAVKKGTEPGPVMLLRADMDALPFKDEAGTPICLHACGHDGHCAMLLTAAAELFDKVKKGTLKIFFQPAEETLKGAVESYKSGIFDDVEIALGLHIRPVQDLKAGDMCAAVRHTSSSVVCIRIKGRGAHASRPHLGVNCAEAAALVTNAVCAIKLDPTKTWSVKVTGINAMASAHNIIPDHAEVWLDCRAQTNPLMTELQAKLKDAGIYAAKAVGAEAEIDCQGILPAAEYDDELTAQVAEEIKKVVGKEHLDKDCGGGGEDFHFYKQMKPELRCAYFGVGVGCEPGLHDRNMHFDPKYLVNGAKILEAMALRYVG